MADHAIGVKSKTDPSITENYDRVHENFALQAEVGDGTEFWPALGWVRLKITDTLIVFFTALLFFATAALWWSTRALVNGADKTAERQLRAYIGSHQYGYQGLENDEPLGVGFSFINYGQLPATNFNLVGIIDILPFPLPPDFELPPPPDRPRGDAIIYPKATNPLTGFVWQRNPISKDEKLLILQRGTKFQVYAHGTATYSDVFGIMRETKFCIYLNHMSIVRDNGGNIVREQDGSFKFQWAPVAGRNAIT